MRNKTFKTVMITAAVPAMLAAGAATAGGLSDAVVEPAPVMVAPAPVVAPSNDWTGFYAGGQLGYGLGTSEAFDEDQDGALYGVHAGYLYDLGSWVVGGEVDYDLTDIEDEGSTIALDSVARAKLRLGYDAGSFMPYLTGGVAQATTSGGLEATDTGAFGGLGMDYMVSDSVRVGAEILQHQFEDFDGTGADVDATTASIRASFQF